MTIAQEVCWENQGLILVLQAHYVPTTASCAAFYYGFVELKLAYKFVCGEALKQTPQIESSFLLQFTWKTSVS